MSSFVKMMRSDVSESLAAYPFANHMLNIIAMRARRTPDLIKGLEIGEAIISSSSLGLTDSQYRHAKKQLTKFGLATFRATNKYTCGKLINTTVYDINAKTNDEPTTSQRRTESQSSDDKLRMKELRMKEDSKKTIVKKASSLKDDWSLPEDYRQWVKDKNICDDDNFITKVSEHFKNHHLSKGNTMKNWKAAWRTWCTSGYTKWPQSQNPKLSEGGDIDWEAEKKQGRLAI